MGGAIGGSVTTYPGDIWHYARSKIVVAARAAGIDAIDGPYADFKNPEGYREEALRSATMGFVGKWAIHPSQIDPANEIYSPSKEEVDRARRLVEVYAKAEAEGLGAITFDGVMIDAASVRIIQNVIDKANLIGM
jgi:citrate lyase subunit beta/citryl-CoA lyase